MNKLYDNGTTSRTLSEVNESQSNSQSDNSEDERWN